MARRKANLIIPYLPYAKAGHMAQRHPELSDTHIQFIARQKLYFVGTAAADGRVNVSPKGMDTLRVLGNKRVAWLNLTGSGNETAAHIQALPRMSLMFCAFEGDPLILRLYGTARVVHPQDACWHELFPSFMPLPGARQIFDMDVDLVQTSCGFGVPYYTYAGERSQLLDWAAKRGDAGLKQYWADRNRTSLDGLPTHILDKER